MGRLSVASAHFVKCALSTLRFSPLQLGHFPLPKIPLPKPRASPKSAPTISSHVDHAAIKNLALVSDLTLDLQTGYNAITGETGAGKSISSVR